MSNRSQQLKRTPHKTLNPSKTVPPRPLRKKSPRPLNIPRNLRPQLLRPRKFLLISNPRMEPYFHPPARQILAEFKQMALNSNPRPIKRRPRPHIRHRSVQLPAHDRFRRINPQLRQQFLLRHQIQSREENRPPAPRPRANFPRQRKRPPQQARVRPATSPPATAVRIAGARNHPPANLNRRNNLHVKPVALSRIRRAAAHPPRRDAQTGNSRQPE